MKQSGGITVIKQIPGGTEPSSVTVIFDEDGDVEKITNQEGEVLYEAEGGGGDD